MWFGKTWTQSILIDTTIDRIESLLINMEDSYVSISPEHHRSFKYIHKAPSIKGSTFHLVEELDGNINESDGLIAEFETGRRLVWQGGSGLSKSRVEFIYEAAGDKVSFTETAHLPLPDIIMRIGSRLVAPITGRDDYHIFHRHFLEEPHQIKHLLETSET